MINIVKNVRKSYLFCGLSKQLTKSWQALNHNEDKHTTKVLSCVSMSMLAAAFIMFYVNGYHAGFHTLNGLNPLLPSQFWAMLTFLGDTTVTLCLMLFFARRNPAMLVVVLITALYGTLASHGMKEYFDALRPPAVLSSEEYNLVGQAFRHNSFPSGHSLSIFILVTVLFYFARHQSTRWLLILFGLSVALSRVMVGAHWPIDTLVGGALGIITTLAAIATAKVWRFGFSPFIHCFVVSLLIISAGMLYYHDGGYPQAKLLGSILASASLAFTILEYLVLPVSLAKAGNNKARESRSTI